MNKKLLSRLDCAIVCINEYDSDEIFNEKLMEVKQYARFIHEKERVLEEILHITNDTLSKARHTKREKKEITEKLRSIEKELKKELFDCLSS